MRRKATTISILVVLVSMTLFPVFSKRIVPEYAVRVVDIHGKPVAGVVLKQTWQDYSIEWLNGSHEAIETTDERGVATLPERRIRYSAFQFALSKARDIVSVINVHASYGAHSFVICQTHSCASSLDLDSRQTTLISKGKTH